MEIELPDGTVLDAPDGADPKVVVANYNRGRTRAAETATLNAMPGMDRFAVGLARPLIRTALGIKQLSGSPVNLAVDEQGGLIGTDSELPTLSDEDKAVLQHLSEVHGKAAFAGDVLGNAAMIAAPGGVIGKATTALPLTLSRLARFAIPATADVAANAGMGALAVPEQGRTRLQGAETGAIGSVGGQAVGKVLGTLVSGAKPYATAIAKRFLDSDIPLTPGQAVGGGVQTLEQNLAKLPFIGSAIKSRQKEALSAWNLKMLADTANGVDTGGTGDLVNAAGPKGFQQAAKIFKDAYDFHWDRPITLDTDSLGNSWETLAQNAQSSLAPEAGAVVQRKLANTFNDIKTIADPKTGTVNGSQLQDIDGGLAAAASDAARSGAGDVAKMFRQAQNDLRSEYPDSFRESLEALNRKYTDFKALTKAGTAISGAGPTPAFTPAALLAGSRAVDRTVGKARFAQGTAPMQPQAVDAMTVFPRSTGTVPLHLTEKTATLLPGLVASPLYSKAGNRFLMGNTKIQKALNSGDVKSLTDAINEYIRPSQIGAAVAEGSN